jgi:hypothetical protein
MYDPKYGMPPVAIVRLSQLELTADNLPFHPPAEDAFGCLCQSSLVVLSHTHTVNITLTNSHCIQSQ